MSSTTPTPTPFTPTSDEELNNKLSTFFSLCVFFNALIEGLVSNLSTCIMTRHEMTRHIVQLELVPTLGLKEYSYLYFVFDNNPEFEDEVYSSILDSSLDDELDFSNLLHKKRKEKITFLKLTKKSIEHI